MTINEILATISVITFLSVMFFMVKNIRTEWDD